MKPVVPAVYCSQVATSGCAAALTLNMIMGVVAHRCAHFSSAAAPLPAGESSSKALEYNFKRAGVLMALQQ